MNRSMDGTALFIIPIWVIRINALNATIKAAVDSGKRGFDDETM